jgi:hypothetical protein
MLRGATKALQPPKTPQKPKFRKQGFCKYIKKFYVIYSSAEISH